MLFSSPKLLSVVLPLLFLMSAPSPNASCNGDLRLNQIQVIGSHNSYHIGMGQHEMEFLRARNPKAAASLDYSHPALDTQFDQGIRQIELDIYADSKGGLYSHPAWPRMMAQAGIPLDPDFDPQHLFDKPGFKVIHVQDLDYRTNCQPFVECLQVVRRWSKAHPSHLPIFILIETKEDRSNPAFMTAPEPFTSKVFDALDAEIRSVFHEDEMITPDQVRGAHPTLEEAVLKNGWPCLQQARGKVLFLMDQRKVGAIYTEGHPSLRNRVIFTNARPGEPDAAFVEVNDPQQDPAMIPNLIKKGYIVRTRTDADLRQARTNDVSTRQAAMASGAQMLSTDFPFQDKSAAGYSVNFPNGQIARCNPVNAKCNRTDLESASAGSKATTAGH
jgi:hypothetical protein